MKNYKKSQNVILKLLMLVMALNINIITCAMSSSARKIVAPAMQSGIRAMTTEAVTAVPTISINSLQNFQPMFSISQQSTLNQTDGIFKNIPKTSLLPQQIYASNSSGSSNNPFYAAILAGLATAMVGNQVAHADDENIDDVEELFMRSGVDPKSYPELVKFIKKYRCSFDLEMQVQFTRSLQGLPNYSMTKSAPGGHSFKASPTNEFKALSGFFIKGPAIDRIINAERMKKVIEKNHLDCLKVADKCLAIRAGDLCVIGKEIKVGDQNKKISLKEIQQLAQLAQQSGYTDWQITRNIIRDVDGKLVFVDTENVGYGSYDTVYTKGYMVSILLFSIRISQIDEDASEWLKSEDHRLRVTKQVAFYNLPHNPQYDAEIGIDFEAVKKEYAKLQENLG